MGTRRRTAAGVRNVTALLLAAVLAACGPQGDPPAPPSAPATSASPATILAPGELLRQAVRTMLDAPSKRLTGTASVSVTSHEFDVVYVGGDAAGTHTNRAMGLESIVEFVRIGESLYLRADEHYWQAFVNLEQLHLVVDKWVLVSAGNPNHASLLVLESDRTRWEPVTVTPIGPDTIDGVRVLVLRDDAGQRFSVAAEGAPYLLRFEGTQSTEAGEASVEIAFSEFGTVQETITAPSGEVVDLR